MNLKSLFTNVTVLETMNIIINNIYHHPTLPPLKINFNTWCKILLLCTTEVPFYYPHGNIFIQKDGIAMGSVLGPIFSNFYMSIIKTLFSRAKLLSSSQTIFLNKLKDIKQSFINNGFPNYIVDTEIKHFINKPEQPNIDNTLNHKQLINLYYKKEFHSNFKIDEHMLKNLIQKMFSLPILPKK